MGIMRVSCSRENRLFKFLQHKRKFDSRTYTVKLPVSPICSNTVILKFLAILC